MRASAWRLQKARNEANLSQTALAHELSRRLNRKRPIHFTSISRWESGALALRDLPTIVAWAGACGIGDFRELLEDDGSEDEEDHLVSFEMVPVLLRQLASAFERRSRSVA